MEINCPSCDEVVLIADEDMGTTIECPFCQQHFALEQPEPPPIEKPPPIIQPQSSTDERIFLECLLSFRRAGADGILTYAAIEMAERLARG